MARITVVRCLLIVTTHKRGTRQGSGRNWIYSRRNVLPANAARHKFINVTKGARQATWDLVIRKGRVTKVEPGTATRAFARVGLKVTPPPSQEEPQRTRE